MVIVINIRNIDISNFIEEIAPINLAESWDNVGLIIGNPDNYIQKVMVCLDVTAKVIEDAITKGVNLIISHHPFIFEGLKEINPKQPQGKAIYDIIQNNINIYAAHTNLDSAPEGVNSQLAELLELRDVKTLDYPLKDFKTKLEGCGFGRIGVLAYPKKIEEFISFVKERLDEECVRVIGWKDKSVEKVAVFCGSYDSSILDEVIEKTDILISGDIKYHAAMEIIEKGFCAIDAGHYGTEKIMVFNTVQMLKNKFPDIEVISSNMVKDPYKYY